MLLDTLNEELSRSGFERHGKKWVREREQFFELVHIQKSQYGPTTYVNIGICLKSKAAKSLGYNDFVLMQRVGRLATTDPRLAALYPSGFPNDITSESAEAQFRYLVSEALSDFLPLCANLSSIQKAIIDGKIPRGGIGRELSNLLKEAKL